MTHPGPDPEPRGPTEFQSGVRRFDVDGVVWVARLAGGGAAGTGTFGLAMIECIEFATAAAQDRPVREVLVQRGIFDWLQDAELRSLLENAPPLSKRRTLEDRS